jgi:Glycosyl hydrolase family 26
MFRFWRRFQISRGAFASLVFAAAVLTCVGVPSAGTAGGSAAVTASPSPLGVYLGYQSPRGVSSFGRAVGDRPRFAMDFLNGDSWSALVKTAPSYMAAWKKSGLRMIWGIPILPTGGSSGDSSPVVSNSGSTLQQGATGAYNSYFRKLAKDMVAGGESTSIIRLGWEFNGDWFPWSASGQAAAFVGYWRQIVDAMRSVAGQKFTFEWNPTVGVTKGGNLVDDYPGSAYVDYVGLDVYDQQWGYYGAKGCEGVACQRDEFRTIRTEPDGLNWLAQFATKEGKPIVLPEWGLGVFNPTDLDGTYRNVELGGGDDPTFIDDMAAWIDSHDVFEATYWDFEPETLRVTPLSAAALRSDFGAGSTTSTTSSGSSGTGTSTSPTAADGRASAPLAATLLREGS